jgi:hypothetical protein
MYILSISTQNIFSNFYQNTLFFNTNYQKNTDFVKNTFNFDVKNDKKSKNDLKRAKNQFKPFSKT